MMVLIQQVSTGGAAGIRLNIRKRVPGRKSGQSLAGGVANTALAIQLQIIYHLYFRFFDRFADKIFRDCLADLPIPRRPFCTHIIGFTTSVPSNHELVLFTIETLQLCHGAFVVFLENSLKRLARQGFDTVSKFKCLRIFPLKPIEATLINEHLIIAQNIPEWQRLYSFKTIVECIIGVCWMARYRQCVFVVLHLIGDRCDHSTRSLVGSSCQTRTHV